MMRLSKPTCASLDKYSCVTKLLFVTRLVNACETGEK